MSRINSLHAKIFIFLGILSLVKECFAYKNSDKDNKDEEHSSPYYRHKPKKEQKYYQDIYIAQLIPEELEFGHVKETPYSWEQRFEKINLDQHRHQGKVKWNDPKHGYGEFYYDFGQQDKDDKNEDEDKGEEKKQTLDDILADGKRLLEKGEVEFIDGKSIDSISNGRQNYHGGNYKTDPNLSNKDKEAHKIKY